MFLHDVRYALRTLLKRPAFTLVAVLILGLGIGANATIFSWVETVVLRPLSGVRAQDQLFAVNGTSETRANLSLSYPNYVDIKTALPPSVTDLMAFRIVALNLKIGQAPQRAWGTLTTGNYFDLLGVKPALGRTFVRDDDRAPGASPVAVISHEFWERVFGGAPEAVGRTIQVNGQPFTVIGVAPAGFHGPPSGMRTDLWLPMMMQQAVVPGDRLHARGNGWLEGVARLAPGATLAQAQAALDVVARRLVTIDPKINAGRGLVAYPLWRAPQEASGILAPILAVLMGVVGLVLLIACANVASLLLARAASRQREVAVRLALGASRWQLVRQLLTESFALAVAGGLVGLLVARWTSGALSAFVPPTPYPIALRLGLDPRVAGFAFLLTVATGIIFGLAPAIQASRPDLVPSLKESAGTVAAGGRRARFRQGLVVGQVALSLVLLVSAGLFLRTLQAAQDVDPGFSTRQGLIASLDLQPTGYDRAHGVAFFRDLVTRLDALPGVDSAALTQNVPLNIGGTSDTSGDIEGYAPKPHEEIVLFYSSVTPGYFTTMGIPVLQGRAFTEADDADAPPVVVINETMAQRYWPGRNPLGGHIRHGTQTLTVVGVVKSGKYISLGEQPRAFMYYPLAQTYAPGMVLVVKTAGDPDAVLPAIRRVAHGLNADVPLFDVRTIAEHLDIALFMQRLAATLLGLFGVLALLLAAIGLYGVVAYAVSQRTQEIGIRMALGAGPGQVMRLILREGMALTLAGCAVGLLLAAGVTRVFASQLVGVGPLDAVSFGGTAVVLALVALVASWLPARRAARVDPLSALRCD